MRTSPHSCIEQFLLLREASTVVQRLCRNE